MRNGKQGWINTIGNLESLREEFGFDSGAVEIIIGLGTKVHHGESGVWKG